MKTLLRATTWLGLLLLSAKPTLAQSADDIVEKHLAASGGRAALSKLTSRVSTGTLTIGTPVGDLDGTVEVSAKAPNKTRTLVKVDLSSIGGGPVVNDQRFDGTSGYLVDTLNGDRDITGDQLDALRNGAFPTPLLTYKERGVEAMLTGEENVGSRPAYVIKFTPKVGPAMRVFIDRETLMVVKTAITANVPQAGGDIEQITEFSDFRDVDGVKIPFVTRSVNPLQTIVGKLTSVKHNVEIDDSSFVRPAGQ